MLERKENNYVKATVGFDREDKDRLRGWASEHQPLAAAARKRRGLARAQFISGLLDAGFEAVDIAIHLNISRNAAHQAIHRARKRIGTPGDKRVNLHGSNDD